MTEISDHDKKQIDGFFNMIEPILAGYTDGILSYLAVKSEGKPLLLKCRLHLLSTPIVAPSRYFDSETVRAGNPRLSELKKTPREIVDEIVSGSLTTPNGVVSILRNQEARLSAHFSPLHTNGLQSQRRQMQLAVNCGPLPPHNSLSMEWELKGAAQPYDSLAELSNEFGVGPVNDHQVNFEIVALNVVEIDVASGVNGTKASIILLLAAGLDPSRASVGLRAFEQKQVTRRERLDGERFEWKESNGLQRGILEIDVPLGTVLQCFANYAGQAHHFYWLSDPLTIPNPRRAAHQAFDADLEALQELLKLQGRGIKARDFESAISWMLWMLGFSVSNIGATEKTSEAPDLIAQAPSGHLLVVECTTGILKAENKLAILIDRTEKVKSRVQNSGNAHLRVLPVIVTNKSRDEVRIDAAQALKDGVLVITKDEFQELLDATLVLPNADALYQRAEETIALAQAPAITS